MRWAGWWCQDWEISSDWSKVSGAGQGWVFSPQGQSGGRDLIIFSSRRFYVRFYVRFFRLNISQNFYNDSGQSRKVTPGSFQGTLETNRRNSGCVGMIHVRGQSADHPDHGNQAVSAPPTQFYGINVLGFDGGQLSEVFCLPSLPLSSLKFLCFSHHQSHHEFCSPGSSG